MNCSEKAWSREASRFFAAGGESPLTLRPNLKSEKGNVTAAAAAYTPAGGFLLVKIKPPLKGEGDRR